jgi:threonine synthase
MANGHSLATGLRCLSCGETFPLDPKLFVGCTACMSEQFQAPLDVSYDYPGSAEGLMPEAALPGLARYAPLLPPLLEELSLQEGGRPDWRANCTSKTNLATPPGPTKTGSLT